MNRSRGVVVFDRGKINRRDSVIAAVELNRIALSLF
jgi:hypothetical protein